MNRLRETLARNANNYRGRRTNRKIVVFESDDWGSVCMPSKNVYSDLLAAGIRVDQCPYASYDSLASTEDLQILFETLSGITDSHGNNPVVTANSVVANPNFEKIRQNNFQEWFYEPFTKSLEDYPEQSHKGAFKLWKEGMDQNLFFPQFHGREHIFTKAWMKSIQDSESPYRSAFDKETTYIGATYRSELGSYRASYEADTIDLIDLHKQNISDGLELFKKIFGYSSISFIAPNYIYHPDLNQTLADEGIKIIQGMKYQKLPLLGREKREMIRHTMGEKNKLGQTYLVRNCVFEPSQYPLNHNNVGECLKGIKNAFFWKKPATISVHRLNFIGHIHKENRSRNLSQFRKLLGEIMKRWPDVEFMSTTDLGQLMHDEQAI